MSDDNAHMSESSDGPNERWLVVTAARRFFLEDRSKVEIAEELGVSRFKVARLLEQARASGVVTIALHDEGTADPVLSARLAEHLALDEALVVEASGTEAEVRHQIGVPAAELLSETLRPGEVLGLAWGRTLSAMTESMPALPRVSVVQLTGAIGNLHDSPVEIVRKVTQSSGGSAYPIFAPLVVDDAVTAAAFRRQADVSRALRMFDDVTTAVVSVGSWDPPNSQLLGAISEGEQRALMDQGVKAEIAAILVSAAGTVVTSDFAARCISISAAQMRHIPRVIGVAGGAEKAEAVVAVARAGLLTGLVTERALAEAALAAPHVVRKPSADRTQH
jgi:DNA-binding transcriptional regulator LsrR (DeoR family)